MARKRTEIIIETERIILIRSRPDSHIHWCGGSSTMDDSAQEPERRDEPFQADAQEQSGTVVCGKCGKRTARS